MPLEEPLDQFDYAANHLSTLDIIALLQKNGFPQTYENSDGVIVIDGQSSLDCRVKKDADNIWTPEVSVKWLSGYVLIPAVIMSLVAGAVGFTGMIAKVVSAFLGLGIGSILLDAKKKKTLAQLDAALFE